MGRKKKKIGLIFGIFFLFNCFFFSVKAQKEIYIRPGLVTASGTLSPSKMLNRSDVNYYITGFLEGRFAENYSARGEIHFLLPNNSSKFLKNNVRLTLGIQYGKSYGNFEIHTGFSPGFGVMKSHLDPDLTEFTPLVQLNLGVRYYVWKYFNFFANTAYTHTRMNNLLNINGLADEIRIEAGLGFNFPFK